MGAVHCFICWEKTMDHFETHKVNPATVGLSTDYPDIYGAVLFEGDIITSGHGIEYLIVLTKDGFKAQSQHGFKYDLSMIYQPHKKCSVHDDK